MEAQKEIIIALVYGIIFILFITCGLILLFHYSRKKIIEKEIEKVNLKLTHQQKILQTTISVQEEERKRIAQDMHDAISSKLNVLSLTTHVLLDDDSTTNDQKESLNHILNITSTTLESARKIAHDLLPPTLEKFGLKTALEELFEEYIKNTSLKIDHNITDISNLENAKELHIFRIIQELINNAVRHGKAKNVSIKIVDHLKHNSYTIQFLDNGLGFNVDAIEFKSGIGIQNIKSRVAILNGTLSIESTIKKGSTFTINCSKNER